LLIKKLSKRFEDLKVQSGTSRTLNFKLPAKSKTKKSEILAEVLKLDDNLIDCWSLYHCSLDDVYFSIVKAFSPPSISSDSRMHKL